MAITKSGSVSVQWHGPSYSNSGTWYVSPNSSSQPRMYATINWSLTRESEKSSTISVKVSGYLWRLFASGLAYNVKDSATGNYGYNVSDSSWTSKFGYSINLYTIINNTEKLIASKNASPNTWTDHIYGTEHSFNIDWASNNKLPIYFRVSAGCHIAAENWCSAGNYTILLAEAEVPTYNPYTAPSNYSISEITPVYGIVGETSFTAKYNITKGSNNISWTNVRLYNSDGNYIKDYDLYKTSTGSNITGSFTLGTDNFSDGQHYKGSVRFYDGKDYFETGQKNIYTYRTPKISGVSLSPSSFSGTGNSTLYWTTNGRRWGTANESNFTTTFKFNTNGIIINSSNNDLNEGDTTNTSTEQSQTLSRSIINSSFTEEQRCKASITTTVTVIRTNPTSKKTASSSSSNITIQFWPKYEISNLWYTDPGNNNTTISTGSTNYIDKLPKVTVNWSYPTNADRGIIDGFIIRIYEEDKVTQVGEDYKVSASTTSKEFNTKTQLRRGELNYIKIIPYYNMPNNEVKEGPATIKQFILPIGRIVKPKIMFPTNNSEWHNKNFRILLTCPKDDDFDIYGIKEAEYRYKDIQVNITGPNDFNKTYTYSSNPTIFSTSTMSYEKDITINPSVLTSFPDLSYYYMKIRFQKNYYENIWSEWSDIILVYNTSISELDINIEDKITISQYTIVRDYSTRLWEVYHDKKKESYDSNNKEKVKGDIIYAINYQGIYNTILAIYNKVNKWCTYDSNRSNVNFTQEITNMSGTLVPKYDELITASKVSTEPTGRNYKNILIECMNKLY